MPVVFALGLQDVDDYTRIFNVSNQMATVSRNLVDSDRYYISHEHWSAVTDMIEACMMGFDSVDQFYRYLAS